MISRASWYVGDPVRAMHAFGHMIWTDQEINPVIFEAEEDPTLARFAVVMYLLASLCATLVTIFITMRSPMHYYY